MMHWAGFIQFTLQSGVIGFKQWLQYGTSSHTEKSFSNTLNGGQVDLLCSPHYIFASNAFSIASPFAVNSQANAPQFTKTVNQNPARNDSFFDL